MRIVPFCCTALLVLTSGCGSPSVAGEFPQIPSYAIAQSQKTSLGDALKVGEAAHPQQSGFYLLTSGSESFAMRLALIEAAEKTLDLQYYSINDDTTANLLLEALVRAAKRGVRIRFLLDNISFDEVDKTFSVLDGFKNLEIRIFNPFATRADGIMARATRLLTDAENLNRRMHNKALIADNQMAIIGGRNLGDEYFEENTDVTFRDLDILAAGPITAKISQSFDNYWNGKDAVPVGQLRTPDGDSDSIKATRAHLIENWEKTLDTENGRKILQSSLPSRLKKGEIALLWAPAEIAADAPQKIDKDREDAKSKPLSRLAQLLAKSSSEFVAVSPYFVPGDEGVATLAALVKRGVRVRVVTNSLASTDVVAAHTGYRSYRTQLVKNGTELYEMKPIGGKRPRQRLLGKSAPAHASLHAKVYAVDRRDVMIGSFNLDPRSLELNTEIALVIHSPALAEQVITMFDEVTQLDSSYRLVVSDAGELIWQTMEKGEPAQYTHEPNAGAWRNIEADFMGLLPIENQL